MLTQNQLARQSGISARTIRELERGRVHRPRGQSVRLLADALGLDGQAREQLHAAMRALRRASTVERSGEAASGTGGGELNGEAAVGEWAAPFLLPPDVADFTGRDVEATRISGLLGQGGVLHGGARRRPLPAEATNKILVHPAAWLDAERRLLAGAVRLACDAGLDEVARELVTSPVDLNEPGRYVGDWRHSLGARRGEALAMAQLGECYLRQGQVKLARALLERSVRSCQELGEVIGQAEALSHLGMLHLDQARSNQAIACLRQAVTMWKMIGRRLRLAQVLVSLGDAYEAVGDAVAARDTWSEALALFRQSSSLSPPRSSSASRESLPAPASSQRLPQRHRA